MSVRAFYHWHETTGDGCFFRSGMGVTRPGLLKPSNYFGLLWSFKSTISRNNFKRLQIDVFIDYHTWQTRCSVIARNFNKYPEMGVFLGR